VDVTIVVVSYQSREWLGPCLESIARGTHLAWEAIVVDNASTDGSADFLEREFPSLRIIRNSTNRGFAAAVNQGIAEARGRFLFLLNPDARLTEGALDLLVGHLESHPECAIVAPQLVGVDGAPRHSIDHEPTLWSALLNKSLFRRVRVCEESIEVESVLGAALLLRRDAARAIGRFDEDYFLFMEETDYCRRVRQNGWTVRFLPTVRVVHLQGKSKSHVWIRAKVEYARSQFTYFRKHRPRSYPLLRIFYPFRMAFEVLGLTVWNVLTLGLARRSRKRLACAWIILIWQLLLCPRAFGLSGRA